MIICTAAVAIAAAELRIQQWLRSSSAIGERKRPGDAGRLRDRLVQHFGADQVFMDVDTLELGVEFGEVIERAVADVDVFLCVMGPDCATLTDDQGRLRLDNPGDFVRIEVASAIARDIRVVRVLVKNFIVRRPTNFPRCLKRSPGVMPCN